MTTVRLREVRRFRETFFPDRFRRAIVELLRFDRLGRSGLISQASSSGNFFMVNLSKKKGERGVSLSRLPYSRSVLALCATLHDANRTLTRDPQHILTDFSG